MIRLCMGYSVSTTACEYVNDDRHHPECDIAEKFGLCRKSQAEYQNYFQKGNFEPRRLKECSHMQHELSIPRICIINNMKSRSSPLPHLDLLLRPQTSHCRQEP